MAQGDAGPRFAVTRSVAGDAPALDAAAIASVFNGHGVRYVVSGGPQESPQCLADDLRGCGVLGLRSLKELLA